MIIIFHHLILFILASISVSTGIVGRVNAQEQQQQQQQQEAEEDKTLEISYINVRFHSDTLQFMDMQIVGHIEPKYYNFYFWYFGYDADELREPVSPEYEEYAEEYAKRIRYRKMPGSERFFPGGVSVSINKPYPVLHYDGTPFPPEPTDEEFLGLYPWLPATLEEDEERKKTIQYRNWSPSFRFENPLSFNLTYVDGDGHSYATTTSPIEFSDFRIENTPLEPRMIEFGLPKSTTHKYGFHEFKMQRQS